jgi:hypothetical protein
MGSGGRALANKCICHARLKRSGAWGYVKNADKMPAPRCATYNSGFDRVFEAHRQKAKQRTTQVSCKK